MYLYCEMCGGWLYSENCIVTDVENDLVGENSVMVVIVRDIPAIGIEALVMARSTKHQSSAKSGKCEYIKRHTH